MGSTSIEVTLTRTASMVRTGFHFSESFYMGFMGSSTGGCRIEMHTYPLGYTKDDEKRYCWDGTFPF